MRGTGHGGPVSGGGLLRVLAHDGGLDRSLERSLQFGDRGIEWILEVFRLPWWSVMCFQVFVYPEGVTGSCPSISDGPASVSVRFDGPGALESAGTDRNLLLGLREDLERHLAQLRVGEVAHGLGEAVDDAQEGVQSLEVNGGSHGGSLERDRRSGAD